MATSGSNTVATNKPNVDYRITWFSAPNITENYSTITVQHWIDLREPINIGGGGGNYSIVNGETKYFDKPALNASSGSHLQGTTIHTVYHNSDGSKSFEIQGYINSDYLSYPRMAFGVTLDDIPRISNFTIADSSVYFNQSLDLTIIPANEDFTHDITFQFGNYSHKITGATTSASFTVPNTWANAIPNALNGQGTVTVTTKSGNTEIGTTSKKFMLYVPTDMIPSFTSISLTPSPVFFDTYYLKGKSAVIVEILGEQGIFGSTISKYSIYLGNGFSSSSKKATSTILSVAQNVAVTCKITDSRGRTATKSTVFTVTDYQNPILGRIVYRVNDNGYYDESGTRIRVLGNPTISSVNGENSVTILRYRQKKTTDINYSSWVNMVSGQNYYFNADPDFDYNVQIECKDNVSESIYNNTVVGSSKSIIDVLAGGLGLAFGGSSTRQNAVEVKNWDMYVNGEEVVTGEKGTWIPTVKQGSFQLGTVTRAIYERVGGLCHIMLVAEARATSTTNTTTIEIGGLPFNTEYHDQMGLANTPPVDDTVREIFATASNNVLRLRKLSVSGSMVYVSSSDFANTEMGQIMLTGTYTIDR